MDVLRPWLGSAVQCELDAVVKWRKSVVDKSQTKAVGEATYEDDGSNLRVASPRIGVIQIIEFQTYEEPIQAVVSDSRTSIQVTFAASAVCKYITVTRKRLTDGTRGGLFQIRAFEIVATHYGPKQSRLTLLIKDFQSLGSDGSGTFGNPLPIGSRQEISVALSQLGEFRAQEHTDSQPQSDLQDDTSASEICSQVIDGLSDDEAEVVMQAAFATQGTRSKFNGKCRLALGLPMKGFDSTTSTTTNIPSLKSSVNVSRLGTGSNSTNEALLDLLTKKKKSGRPTRSNVPPDASLNQGSPRASGQGIKDSSKASEKDNSTSLPLLAHNEAPGQIMAPDLILMATQPAQAKATQSPGPLKSQFPRDLQTPSQDPSNTKSFAGESGATMQRSGTDLSNGRPERDVTDPVEHALPRGLDASLLKIAETDNDAEEHPWKGMNRISQRDVTISQDQQALLDKQDSWLPPEPGHRGPVANVPIAVLQSLNALAERRATQARRVKGNRPLSEGPDDRGVNEASQLSISSDEESEDEQESDVVMSSSEWPPSSSPPLLKRNELPPDSSAASPDPPTARYMAEATDTPGRESMVASNMGRNSSPHDAPTRYQTSGSSIQPSQLPGQQFSKHYEGNVASKKRSLHGSGELTSIQTTTHSSPRQQACAYQLETATLVQMIPDGSSRAAPDAGSRDVTPSKRSAHLAGLSADSSIHILSEDDEMSDSENSLLDTSVPLALGDQSNEDDAISGTRTVLSRVYPSTISQERKPVIQVKRTPKANGQVSKQTTMQLASEPLHITEDDHLRLESKEAKRLSDNAELSDPVIPGSLTTQLEILQEDVDSTMLGIDVADNHSATYDEEALVNQQIQSEVDAQSVRSASVSPVKHEVVSPGLQATGQSATRGMGSNSPVRAVLDTKRKAEDRDVLSPNITKRRKRLKPPPAFKFSQDQQEIQDPSILARQQRREFFASRKGSVLQSNTGLELEMHEEKAFEAGDATAATSSSIYNRFQATYPEYSGDLKHFIAMAKKIDTLIREDRMEHRFLWDDFIVRHKMEYGQYLLDCMEKAEDPITYERFYRNEIDEPKFTKEFIAPKNIADMLALEGLNARTEQPRRSGVERQPAFATGSPAPVRYCSSLSRDEAVIDLTADSQEHPNKAEPKVPSPVGSLKKGPRPIPWAKSTTESDSFLPAQRKGTGRSVLSTHSLPLLLPSQARFKKPISASASPLRPRSAPSDVSLSAVQRTEPRKPTDSNELLNNSYRGTAPQDRSSVTDWLDNTSTHAIEKDRGPPSIADWWADVNAPFKSFARAYVSIESGRGNSFAKPSVQGYKQLGTINSEGLVRPMDKEMDVSSWKI